MAVMGRKVVVKTVTGRVRDGMRPDIGIPALELYMFILVSRRSSNGYYLVNVIALGSATTHSWCFYDLQPLTSNTGINEVAPSWHMLPR